MAPTYTNSLSVTSQMLCSLATINWDGHGDDQIASVCGLYKPLLLHWLPQLVVTKGNNIIEVTERIFTAGYCYSLLWLKTTAFESSKGWIFWPPYSYGQREVICSQWGP